MLIDTHSHINHEKLVNELPEILQNLKTGKVKRVICPSFSYSSSITSLEMAKNENVFCALGIHPEMANEYDTKMEQLLIENANNLKVVAIGEIGLDYHYGQENKDLQFQVLLRQMELAKEFDLPIIFHIRDAFDDFFEFFEKHKDLCKKGVIHCFEGDIEVAKKALSLGLMISFTGLITFKHRENVREAVKYIPLEKIMVETDAPYLTPEPFRHKVNRPEYVELVAQKIAEIKGESVEKVEEITTQNAYDFFDKMRKFDESK